MMLNNLAQETSQKLLKAIETLKSDLSSVRTGRANSALIENVKAEVYGTQMRLLDLATINAPDARLLVVQPFDQNNTSLIEKAIRNAGLGLNPATEGQIIRVPLPPLSEETRKSYLKIVHDKSENSRVAVRNIRREAMDEIDRAEKVKEISEDEKFRLRDQIQKEVDKVSSSLEELVSSKEKDLMQV